MYSCFREYYRGGNRYHAETYSPIFGPTLFPTRTEDLTVYPARFDAGSIPSNLGDLKEMAEMNLRSTDLSGEWVYVYLFLSFAPWSLQL